MSKNITPAGFILIDDSAIHGRGETAAAAWEDFRAGLDQARITLLTEADDSSDMLGSWTRESDYRCLPASAALLDQVEACGGDIVWDTVYGVACTRAEFQAAEEGDEA